MLIQNRWTMLALWLAIGCVAVLSCTLTRPAAHIDDQYFPVGNDSFYHAVRILDAVRDPASFYEFDPKIHAPEGSLLVWPWGYDYLMAKTVRAAVALGLGSDPLMVLLWIPVAAVFIGTGLMMLVARRLELQTWPVALAGLCMALNASTQLLYGFGQVDHHFAEHIFVLGSLAAGLGWFRAPSVSSGAILGVTFGTALAIHNALFILQAPFLATALLLWLQGTRVSMRSAIAFGAALLGSSLAMLLPSLPFQEGRFEFYTLSWFHLYIVCCTSAVVILLARLEPTRRSILMIVAIGAALIVPLLKQIAHAQSFVSGSLGMLDQILEMRSPLQLLFDDRATQVMGFYTLLAFVSPVTFALCVIRLWRERRSPRLLFWIWCVFGMVLMTMQLRMHYFGMFALFLPWLIVAQEIAMKRDELRKRTYLVAALLLVIAYIPVIRYALVTPMPPGGEEWFAKLYPMFPTLQRACAEDPGVVLADTNAGHYIRYFTDCSVVANNFLLTRQQFHKVDEVSRLFSLTPLELMKQAPYLKYVIVRPANIVTKADDNFSYEFFGSHAPTTPNLLLLQPSERVPPQFKMLFEVKMLKQEARSQRLVEVPYARLYEIDRGTVSPTETSVNNVSE